MLDSAVGLGQTVPVLGPAIIIFVLVIIIPVGVMVSGGIFAGVLGFFLKKDIDHEFEGTEYIDLA